LRVDVIRLSESGVRAAAVRRVERLAVLFADICGSTRLYSTMGDEAARAVVDACIATLLGVLPRYEGRLIKTLGDEVMCSFPDADQAVMAASEMQSRIVESPPAGYPLAIHIGLHYGPVLVESGDIYGDTVNAAAYLCAVAAPEQILIADATEASLSAQLRACVRPVFYAVLKGNTEESTIHQVLWHKDNTEITNVNLRRRNVIPADLGSLVLVSGNQRVRIDQQRPSVLLGRAPDCEIVVADRFASRQHAVVRVERTHFYLIDQSINGTFVRLDGGDEVHVLRNEVLLGASGSICLGRSFEQSPQEVVTFARDRRALYRV